MSNVPTSIIRYSGTFRFRTRDALEDALARARRQIDEEHDLAALEGGWLRCFVMFDTSLTVNIALPALPYLRSAAAEIFARLSTTASDGMVTAKIDDIPVELYTVHPMRRDRISI